MHKPKWMICFVLLIFCSPLASQQQEKIREEVTVINVEVPVRVFYKGKTVAGLKKSDFRLFVGKKAIPIHGFSEYKKKIQLKELEEKEKSEIKPRLFLIILNVSDYNDDVAQNVDYLFEKIIRKGDRLIVLSNNFFLNDHLALDIKKEKTKIIKIAQLEAKKIQAELIKLERELDFMVSTFSKKIQDELDSSDVWDLPIDPRDINSHTQDFVSEYLRKYSDYKEIYFSFKDTQYLQIANYLSEQSCEKWGLNLYQIGLFPKLKRTGRIYRLLEQFRREYEAGVGEGDTQTVSWMIDLLFQRINQELQGADYRGEEDIAKPFIGTGVSLHTLLMRPTIYRTLEHFEYKLVKIESENMLRKISTMTGGQVIGSNKAEEFVEKIVNVEDVYYRLTFDPAIAGVDAKAKVKVKTNNPNYQLIYDNQQRPRYVAEVLEKVEKKSIPITINGLMFENRILSFDISNIHIPKQGEDAKGEVDVRIKVVDDKFNVKHDRKKVLEPTQNHENVKIDFSKLKPGNYDAIVEVSDLKTGMNDLALKEMQVGLTVTISLERDLTKQLDVINKSKDQQHKKNSVEAIQSTVPVIRIREMIINNRDLKVSIENILITQVEENAWGKVEVSILVLDSGSNQIAKRKSKIEVFRKSETVNIGLGEILNGNHKIIIEARDLLSGKNNIVMVDINVTSQKIILGNVIELDSSTIKKSPSAISMMN